MIFKNYCIKVASIYFIFEQWISSKFHSHLSNSLWTSSLHSSSFVSVVTFVPVWCWTFFLFPPQRFEQIATLSFFLLQTQQCDINSKGNFSNLKVLQKSNYSKYFTNLRNAVFVWNFMKCQDELEKRQPYCRIFSLTRQT